MFDPEELPYIKQAIRDCALVERQLLTDLRSEVLEIKASVRVIKPRTINTFSLVATDGTSNKLVYNPFYFQLIRVVDSNGNNECSDVLTPSTNTDELSARQFDERGEPKTVLGTLMRDLKCKTLSELSPMIPSGKKMREHPEDISRSWVLTYRDLCEWAVLYDKICYKGFANHTVIVRDGLLRSKIFKYDQGQKRPLFIEMMDRIKQKIDKDYKEKRIRIYIAGIAKHSQVLSRYSLAIQLEGVFPAGDPRFARVPELMEERSYVWKEYMARSDEDNAYSEVNKFSVGSLYLARFGKQAGDPIWAIDLLNSQTDSDADIFGYLYMDTFDGFPIPHYPACLQKALEHAQVVDFDLDILQDEVVASVKNLLPAGQRHIVDHQNFTNPSIANRQS